MTTTMERASLCHLGSAGESTESLSLAERLLNDQVGQLRFTVESEHAGTTTGSVCRTSDGQNVGSFRRHIREDGSLIAHEGFGLHKTAQRHGRGQAWVQNCIRRYAAQFPTFRVVLNAHPVSAYQWARCGFQWADPMANVLLESIARFRQEDLTVSSQLLLQQLADQIAVGLVPTAPELADWARGTPDNSLGKCIMLLSPQPVIPMVYAVA